jgi:hypothetical protein
MTWKSFLSERNKKKYLIISFVLLTFTLFFFYQFLSFNESRSGFIFLDPILNAIGPVDVSFTIFLVTYSLSFFGIVIVSKKPELLIKLVQAYTLMTLLRMLSLYLLPLEPPFAIIPLKDVFLRLSFYAGRENVKDLFFSGHTATLFLFSFVFLEKKLKWLFTFGAVMVGMLLMLQHVHYSVDVFAAPIMSYLAVLVQRKLNLY